MHGVFVICALIGGTVLLFQFVLTLIGLGGEALDVDMPDDIDVDMDVDFDADMDGDAAVDHGSSPIFGVLSFRTVVAALTFFGLGGLAANSTGAATHWVLVVAVAAGLLAMYVVYWLMRGLYRLTSEGTAKIQRAVGRHATVYLRIPGHESGTGKIQVNLQNRTMEYLAMTSGDELPTGAKVVVVDVITPTTVEVQPVLEPERIEDV